MDAAWIGALAGAALAACAVLAFWMGFSDRISKAHASADKAQSSANSALQVAAECDEEKKELEKRVIDLERDGMEAADRIRREFGETVDAMRQKIHEFETWARDEFVRKQSLEAMMTRTEKAQELRDERLEKRLDRIEKKLDEASAIRNSQ